jgi:lipid A 3-O-deacylase
VGEGRQAESGSLAKLRKTLRDCEARPVGCAFSFCASRKRNQNTDQERDESVRPAQVSVLNEQPCLQNQRQSGNLIHMERMRWVLLVFFFLLATTTLICAQDGPEQGGNEVQVWAGGGHSVPGGTSLTEAFNAGIRYGRVITGPHWPGMLRGRFEYAVDLVPVYLIFQPANRAYGWGFNPLVLKWNFERRGRFSPYFELSGGTLFSNHNIPSFTNTVNFTPSAALGTHILGEKYNWSVDVRYLHISNAGLARYNPGLNTVQVRLGVGRFWKQK